MFRRFGELAVPTFAFVNGAALGGGVELPLHCTYRTVSSGVGAIALPECFLGLVPGWGGTYLLPNLVGPEKAVEVIIGNALNTNTMLNGPKAFAAGHVRRDLRARRLPRAVAGLGRRGAHRRRTVERAPVDRSEELWEGALKAGKRIADAKVHGAAPAPYRALDLIRLARTADRDTAFEAESQALADLTMGDELRASLYAFDLVNRRARKPVGVPDAGLARPVTTVGIVGAGLMASQLALLFVRRLQVPVVLTDLDQARVDKGVAWVHGEIDTLRTKKRVSADAANRLKGLVTGSTSKEAFAEADLVIEAVFEELGVKKQVFAEVEAVVKPDCVLTTNTSSLSVTEMAADLEHPERVVGFHFFNPVAVLPLVEVVRGERTDDADAGDRVRRRQAAEEVVRAGQGRAGVRRQPAPHPLPRARSPGPSTRARRSTSPTARSPPLGPAHAALRAAAARRPGGGAARRPRPCTRPSRTATTSRRTCGGWSRRAARASTPGTSAGGPTWTTRRGRSSCRATARSTEAEVRDRALRALAEESRLMLDAGVVAEPQDLDLCMILGAGWPFHLGGITPYLDRTGTSEAVTGRRFLPRGVASVPA